MKLLSFTACLLAAAALVACGSSDSQGAGSYAELDPTSTPQQIFQELHETSGKPPLPRIPPSSDPPPKKVVIRDIRKGHGPPIKPRQQFTTNFIAFEYDTGLETETHWGKTPFQWNWRWGGLTEGWEIGLAGMQVGGRRQLIVPSKLAYGSGDLVYLIELVRLGAVQPPA
jgi:peptidylprolyl isomerase